MSEALPCVPVREDAFALSSRLFRTATAAAAIFSSPMRLTTALGTGQRRIRPSEPPLRRMADDLDVTGIVIGPAGTMTRTSPEAA